MRRLLLLLVIAAGVTLRLANYEAHPLAEGVRADRIVVEKSARTLTLFHGKTSLKTYSIALGRAPEGKKQREGDLCTPEGSYTIDAHNHDSAFHRALHISYPRPADSKTAARNGEKAGGDIMVHGIPNGLGWIGALHRSLDWTAGCIAVTDKEIEEIYRAVPNGTSIEIRP